MRRTLFILGLMIVLLLNTLLPAQDKVQIGLIGGFNFADLDVGLQDEEDNADYNFKIRSLFGVGAVVEYSIARNLSLLISPMYIKKGSNIEFLDAPRPIPFNWELTYLDIDISIKVTLGDNSIRPYLLTGPTVSVLLSARSSTSDIQDDLKDVDLGVNLGAGIRLQKSWGSMFLQGIYKHSLRNISDTFLIRSFRNKGIQIMLGVSRGVGG